MFSGYLQFRTMDKVHKPSDSECYKPSSALSPFILAALHSIKNKVQTSWRGLAETEEVTMLPFPLALCL
jgi:hypothetical protein